MTCDNLQLVTLPHIPSYIKYVTAQSNDITYMPSLNNTHLKGIDVRNQIHRMCVNFDASPHYQVLGLCSQARHDYSDHQSNVLKYIFK